MSDILVVGEEAFLASQTDIEKAGYNVKSVEFVQHPAIKPVVGFIAIPRGQKLENGIYKARVRQKFEPLHNINKRDKFGKSKENDRIINGKMRIGKAALPATPAQCWTILW